MWVSDRLPEEMLFSMPVVADNGDTLRLTAFLSDMDDIPSKGTPITSGNIGLASGYGTFNTSVYQGTDIYESVDDDDNHYPMALVTAAYDGTTDPSNPCWDLTGGKYYWPEDESRKLTFCSYGPVTCNGVRTAVEWIVPASNEISTSFSYTLPEPAVTVPFNDAERQQDLLFAIDRNQTKSGRKRNGVSYAEVHFYHALTAVRFTRGAELNDCVIRMTSVTMLGNGSGKAVAAWTGSGRHDNGGAIYLSGTSLTMNPSGNAGVMVAWNSAVGDGGNVDIADALIEGCVATAGNGGGVAVKNGTYTVTESGWTWHNTNKSAWAMEKTQPVDSQPVFESSNSHVPENASTTPGHDESRVDNTLEPAEYDANL